MLKGKLSEVQNMLVVLDDTYATDEELAVAVTQLKELLTQTEAGLEQKILQVQSELDIAIEELNESISANKADIEAKLAELDEAYKAADAIINSELSALKDKDGELADT